MSEVLVADVEGFDAKLCHGEDSVLRLTIYIGEADQRHHRPLYSGIIHRAHAAGVAGAAAFRGFEGFGASPHIRTTRLLSESEHLPVSVVMVDTEDRIRAFLPQLDELIQAGTAINVVGSLLLGFLLGGATAGGVSPRSSPHAASGSAGR